MIKRILFIFIGAMVLSTNAFALDTEVYLAKEIKILDGNAQLLSHESVFIGMSCRSGPVGNLTNITKISIGDTISLNNHTFKVGLIEVTKFNEDAVYGKTIIAKKGDIVCVVAENKKALPDEDDCDALWVRIPKCQPLK